MTQPTIQDVREAIARCLTPPRKLRLMSKRRRKIATKRRAMANIINGLRPYVGRVIDVKLRGDMIHTIVELIPPADHITINCVIEKPERQLTEQAQADRADFERYDSEYGGCSCFQSAPCGWCTHPGNPHNQDEFDDCWEPAP